MINNFKIYGLYDCIKTIKLKLYFEEIQKINENIKFEISYFHENEYYNEIQLLKDKNFNNNEIKLLKQDDSPIIFKDKKFYGNFEKIFKNFIKNYYLEANYSIEHIKNLADKNMEKELYQSGKNFVDFNFENEENSFNIRIQLFSKTPIIKQRFMELCKGINIENNLITYLNSNIKRVEKDNYIQLGEINKESLWNNWEEENFIYKHDQCGMLAMVTGILKHSIKSQFFITLQKLNSFNKNYVVFGKVVKGFNSLIEKISDSQNINSYIPTKNYNISKIKIYEQRKKDEVIERENWLLNRQKYYPSEIKINSKNSLKELINEYKNNNYLNGPKIVIFENLDNLDFFSDLTKIFLNDLEILKFYNCNINNIEIFKLWHRTNFFDNLKEIYFLNIELNCEILSNFINGKINWKKFYFDNVGFEGNKIFSYILENNSLNNLESLIIRDSNLKSSSIDYDKLNNFTVLDLSNNNLYDEGLIEFFTNYNGNKLKELYLDNCKITQNSLKEIFNNFNFKNLKVLDLSNCYDINPFMENFIENKVIQNINKLVLKRCYLDGNVIKKMLMYPIICELEYLDLSYNFKLDEVLSSLKNSIFLRNLKSLILNDCNLSYDYLALLTESNHLQNLKFLDFSQNKLDIIKFLMDNSEFELIKWLDKFLISLSTEKEIKSLENFIKDSTFKIINIPLSQPLKSIPLISSKRSININTEKIVSLNNIVNSNNDTKTNTEDEKIKKKNQISAAKLK